MLCNDVPEHPNVTVLKGIPDERLAQAYSTAWLFCYPSIYEGFGMAYMEAMASGTAILTSANTGADDVLQKGIYGVIADDCNFAAVLLNLLQNQHERNQLGQLGLRRSADFHIDRVVEQHLNHYHAVLGETN